MNQSPDPFLLSVNNLRTEFRTSNGIIKAVDDISFSIRQGETLGIVGESGSGKSVTALSIMRLINPPGNISGGQINYSGNGGITDLLSLPEKEIQSIRGNQIAMIFQEPMSSLNPVFRCGDQVAESLIFHKKISSKEAKEQTIELFEKIKLPRAKQLYDSYPHEISGGQKQRVMIAMAVCCRPGLLVADEPTTALDVTVQSEILKLLHTLREENRMSMLFITHDLSVVAEIADRIAVMYKGKIVETGRTSELFKNPQHPYTKGLLACRPQLNKRLRVLPVISDFMKENPETGFTEIPISVNEAIHLREIPDAERKARLEKIYAKPPILRVNNLATWFPVRKNFFGTNREFIRGVDHVSFDVFPGETVGLAGESGCGKTTLGRSIIRLTEPKSGSVIFRENDLSELHGARMRAMRKNIQLIFQDPYSSLNPRMTIGNAIMEPMQIHRMHGNDSNRKAKAKELLARVNMDADLFDRYPHEFSGGQRQRICIARALAPEPEFIICDECVSALDVSIQAQVLNLLNELKREFGLTYIFISHDLSVVKFMSDRIIIMKDGTIEEIGNADDVYANPRSAYTRKLIEAIPVNRNF